MRARKLGAIAPEDPPPPDDVGDAWPADEASEADRSEEPGPIARLCIECGTDDCREHGEIARLDAPSRTLRDTVSRLRRAASEHRAAARALRVLVLSEVARGRGDLETTATPPAEPCPRCVIRDAEAAATPAAVAKGTARRAKGENGQQALPFKVS
jgi:hypothetical protein